MVPVVAPHTVNPVHLSIQFTKVSISFDIRALPIAFEGSKLTFTSEGIFLLFTGNFPVGVDRKGCGDGGTTKSAMPRFCCGKLETYKEFMN